MKRPFFLLQNFLYILGYILCTSCMFAFHYKRVTLPVMQCHPKGKIIQVKRFFSFRHVPRSNFKILDFSNWPSQDQSHRSSPHCQRLARCFSQPGRHEESVKLWNCLFLRVRYFLGVRYFSGVRPSCWPDIPFLWSPGKPSTTGPGMSDIGLYSKSPS